MCPAYCRPADAAVVITFQRNDAEPDIRTARDGRRAVLLAMRMIAVRDELLPGDKLTIEAADEPSIE